MKRNLAIVCMIIILASCKKISEPFAEQAPANLSKNGGKVLGEPGDGVWDVLGNGYDITGNYANSASSRLQIVDVEKMDLENPTYVMNSGAETGNHIFVSSSNVEDFSSELMERYEATVGLPKIFGGTVSESFSEVDKWSSKYIYATYSSVAIKKTLYMLPDVELIKNYLYPGFLNHVQTLTPQQLVGYYGTHLLTHIKVGGKLELVYRAETHSTNRKEAAGSGAKASFKEIFGMNTEGSYSETEASLNFNEKAFVRTIGGNSAAGLVNTITFNAGEPLMTFNPTAWSTGVTDQNAELIDIVPGGLIPIYELISDSTKKAQLKNYIDQYMLDHRVRMYHEVSYKVGIDIATDDHVFYWDVNGLVSSGYSTGNLMQYRTPEAYVVPGMRNFSDILDIGITNSNWCYAWFKDGTVSAGYSNSLGAYLSPSYYTVAAGKSIADLVAISIAKNTGRCYAWYRDGTGSIGTSTDLDAYGTFAYSVPPGKMYTDIVDIGIAKSTGHCYAWYKDGTVSSGTSDDLDQYQALQSMQ